ncbi:hypothetical protein [Streptomyces echinatus]|uniref:hypothetical protein n=1 Tax=Streptomyces echinatus TaxID=67293 RepID=UPI00379C28D7
MRHRGPHASHACHTLGTRDNQHGTWLLIVEGTTYSAARRAARHAAARAPEAKARSLRGVDFLYRRLRSGEIPATFAELHAAAVRSA